MSRLDTLLEAASRRQAARWDRIGGPGAAWRWALRRPLPVTIGLALLLGVVLGVTFGVPPFSPLVLVVVIVAPVHPFLRVQRRAYARWEGR